VVEGEKPKQMISRHSRFIKTQNSKQKPTRGQRRTGGEYTLTKTRQDKTINED